jgi:hypothetical protein
LGPVSSPLTGPISGSPPKKHAQTRTEPTSTGTSGHHPHLLPDETRIAARRGNPRPHRLLRRSFHRCPAHGSHRRRHTRQSISKRRCSGAMQRRARHWLPARGTPSRRRSTAGW